MSAIDTQNAKQIRDPMQVLISLDVPDSISMTYTGYTGTAKLYDSSFARLANYYKTWPMRKLADLQADGFPLDGSCALYNSSVTPSLANGKLGVRGHTGQTLSLTASSSSTIKALSLYVTGAASVTYGGTTASITGNQAVIQVNASSVSMSFTPTDSTHRIEVSAAIPGTSLVINNANMISATVSLRSDLSLYNQTLPESELNVEVYNDVDISEAVAGIPDDTPITYQAGYAGDMSPVRKFYIAGQVKWKDNVLSIHAVDAVHFLDNVSIGAPLTNTSLDYLVYEIQNLLEFAGIGYQNERSFLPGASTPQRWILTTEYSPREYIAFCNNYMNITDDDCVLLDGSAELSDELQVTYVDAGIPVLYSRTSDHTKSIRIMEDDCTDISINIDRPVSKVNATVNFIVKDTIVVGPGTVQKVGSASWVKNVGVSLSFEKYADAWVTGLYLGANYDNDVAEKLRNTYGGVYSAWKCMVVTVPGNAGTGWNGYGNSVYVSQPHSVGFKLPYTDIPQDVYDNRANKVFSTFIPWGQAYNGTWNYDGVHTINSAADSWNMLVNAGIVRSDATSMDLDIYGAAYDFTPTEVTYSTSGNGVEVTLDNLPFLGKVLANKSNNTAIEIFPAKMLSAQMYRSNITGSFKWKGDPRMQPRDVVKFGRLDGTDEYITLENITLHHEGGGTWADITYRKGVI